MPDDRRVDMKKTQEPFEVDETAEGEDAFDVLDNIDVDDDAPSISKVSYPRPAGASSTSGTNQSHAERTIVGPPPQLPPLPSVPTSSFASSGGAAALSGITPKPKPLQVLEVPLQGAGERPPTEEVPWDKAPPINADLKGVDLLEQPTVIKPLPEKPSPRRASTPVIMAAADAIEASLAQAPPGATAKRAKAPAPPSPSAPGGPPKLHEAKTNPDLQRAPEEVAETQVKIQLPPELMDGPAAKAAINSTQAILQAIESMSRGEKPATPIDTQRLIAALAQLLIRKGMLNPREIVEALSKK